jgi:quinol monooxygenase YgiN
VAIERRAWEVRLMVNLTRLAALKVRNSAQSSIGFDDMANPLTIVAHLHVRQDKLDEAKAFLLGLVEGSRSDPDCIDYHLHQDNENPLEFTFYENWVSRAAWDRHMQLPPLKELARRREEFFAAPTEIRLMTMISSPE